MPVPQICALVDSSIPKKVASGLSAVSYSSRYAMALFYDRPGDFIGMPDGVCAKYINNDPILRYMSVDTLKRQSGCKMTVNKDIRIIINHFLSDNQGQVSIIFHTSVPFGIKHVEKTPDDVKPLMLDAIKKLFPEWPEPTSVKCQKWRYSQTSTPYEGEPGCVPLHDKPLLLAGGDGFTKSGFDGCIASAESIAAFIQKHF